MTEQVSYDDVKPGAELAPASYPVTRLSLVKYCGASGDFNVIHWNERIARSVGLPNVIAHPMVTIADAGRYGTHCSTRRTMVAGIASRFSSPVVVPDDDAGATIEVSGVVEDKLDDNQVVLVLTARSGGEEVLTRARAVVRLP